MTRTGFDASERSQPCIIHIDNQSHLAHMRIMIICVCRRLNTEKVTAAIEDGARTPACVLAHHGTRFNCGKCREEISEMIDQTPAGELGNPGLLLAAE